MQDIYRAQHSMHFMLEFVLVMDMLQIFDKGGGYIRMSGSFA